ncbi:hypothetical protein CYY_008213 [Polysphondylium violaceum]|uniref:SGTA homodimerisation domain-containing protein n=1 Tax=Polysphondylium violaceum TaxID=133409 RepID=A0A8J4V1H6_9MYCE|nr:hypothetical protein CYY_008213 [Polysphondylium violaceum]
MENKQKLAVSILNFLKETLSTLPADSAESLEVSMDCIRDVFGVNESDPQLQSNASLLDIFTAYSNANNSNNNTTTSETATKLSREQVEQELYSQIPPNLHGSFKQFVDIIEQKGAFNGQDYERVLRASKQKFAESKAVEIKEAAERVKVEGNNKLQSSDFQGALNCYNTAIAYDPTNAIYYANRAATYSSLGQFENAVQDSQESINKNPNYAKAYARLGSANLSLGKNQEAAEAFKKALELEPNNENYKTSLNHANSKSSSSPTTAASGLPDMGGLDFSNLGSLLENPMIKNFASSMMNNPEFKDMLESGGAADMAKQMMNNPDMMKMFSSMMKK